MYGQDIVREAFAVIEACLPETGYAKGVDFTIADSALFYVFSGPAGPTWPCRPRCLAQFERLRARPVVHQVLREKGYH